MATTRIMPLHIGKGRTESRAISDIIDYVANPQKTDNGKLITGYGWDSPAPPAEVLLGGGPPMQSFCWRSGNISPPPGGCAGRTM